MHVVSLNVDCTAYKNMGMYDMHAVSEDEKKKKNSNQEDRKNEI